MFSGAAEEIFMDLLVLGWHCIFECVQLLKLFLASLEKELLFCDTFCNRLPSVHGPALVVIRITPRINGSVIRILW